MKKATSIILLALALVAGLTQCKKNNDTNITDNEGEKQHITLDVKQGGDAKLDVDAPHVVFQTGDQILVASDGVYVGTLAYNGTNFAGNIEGATPDLPLYFYLMGNVTPAETLTKGSTTSCSVSISDQTTNKPVIACAPSVENFGTTNSFTSTLRNKCALVKFSVTTSSTAATSIKGFNNKVTVDFAENTLTPSQEGEGIITLPAGNGDKWAILLPQDPMEAGGEGSAFSTDGSAFSTDGYYSGTLGAVPTIDNNGYLTYGIPVTVTTYVPTGILSGAFSVSATKQVRFSKGNLQYIGTAGNGDDNNTGAYWKFAENQWEYYGTTTNQNNVGDLNKKTDRDLLGWGTSGYPHGAIYYQPWQDDYPDFTGQRFWAYSTEVCTYNLYDQTGKADWGYNAIRNGGNQENSGWRTLTVNEWDYIFNSRTEAGYKWGRGNVHNVNGMILLPDEWTLPVGLSFTSSNNNWTNVYTDEEWTQMEDNGAVFLPAAGYRVNMSEIQGVGTVGWYQSSSVVGVSAQYENYYLGFDGTVLEPWSHHFNRKNGCSVRLVRDAE